MDTEEILLWIFGETFTVEDRENVLNTVEHLQHFKSAKTKDVNQSKKYIKQLRHYQEKSLKIQRRMGADESRISEVDNWITGELEKVDIQLFQYNSIYVSLLKLNWKVEECFEKLYKNDDSFYAVLDLVKGINSYYDIKEPYKPANKIAYGWNLAIKKDSKAYLYGVIKNYLIKNNVEVNSVEIRKIVGFLECEYGDE